MSPSSESAPRVGWQGCSWRRWPCGTAPTSLASSPLSRAAIATWWTTWPTRCSHASRKRCVLSGLHPKANYGRGVLELEKAYEAVVEPAGRGITLVPCVFVTPHVEVLVQPGYQPTLAYGPRGVVNLWTSSPVPNGTALEAALGTGRATVLKGLLLVPRTTTELAHQLRLSPAAVSAHLSRLKAAELVEPHRSGKRVYYRLSGAGESLLGIFGELE
jgi:DNA-binding transcriptional ArsR family regulator